MRKTTRVGPHGVQSIIKSIQRGTVIVTPGNASASTNINAVDLNNSFVNFVGFTYDATGDVAGTGYLNLSSNTAVTYTRDSSIDTNGTPQCSFEVVEYWPGVLRTVQVISATFSIANSVAVTISPVDTAKTMVFFNGNTTNTYDERRMRIRAQLTDYVTVTFNRDPNSAAGTAIAVATVVEFY